MSIFSKMGGIVKEARGAGCFFTVIGVVIFVVASIIMSLVDQPDKIPDTKYFIATESRVYYSNQVTKSGEDYYLYGYWSTKKGHWKYHDEVLPLSEKLFGKIEVVPEVK